MGVSPLLSSWLVRLQAASHSSYFLNTRVSERNQSLALASSVLQELSEVPQQRFILFPLEWLGARRSCYPCVPLRQQPAHCTDSNLGWRGIVLSTNTQQEPSKPVRWERQMVEGEEAVLPFHTAVEAQGYRMGSSWGGNRAQHLSLSAQCCSCRTGANIIHLCLNLKAPVGVTLCALTVPFKKQSKITNQELMKIVVVAEKVHACIHIWVQRCTPTLYPDKRLHREAVDKGWVSLLHQLQTQR